jgi:O-antigen/teichoic acid export membrane protein
LTLLIVALAIMGIIMINATLIVRYLGDIYTGLPLLMIILGTGKLIELGTGMNAQILQLSKHWRIDLFTNMFFVVVSIIFNYFLTKKYGLVGTAAGSVMAILLFNSIRYVYIKNLLKLQPFSLSNFYAICIAIFWGGICYVISFGDNLILNHIIKTILFFVGFTISIIKMNLSEDITDLYLQIKRKVFHSN